MFITYEALQADTVSELHRLLKFLNKKRDMKVWTYDEVYDKYSALYGDSGASKITFPLPNMDKYIIFIILIVVIIVAYFYYNKSFNMRTSVY